jgi:pimeloyl-ACP methyl ester carboxylesterase/SAM-dependent methyltransferase
MALRKESMIAVGGIELCVQTFGDPADPALLLLAGMTSSMDWWDTRFCARLAAGSRFVIRYDQRDTGRSATCPVGRPGYRSDDLVLDAAGVLDALGVAKAHMIGISMGGALAQLLTLDHPERVLTLTLISTSAGAGDNDLPGMAPALRAWFAAPPAEPDWSDREAVIDYLVEQSRPYAASSVPYDTAAVRAIAEVVVDRSRDIAASMTNHSLVAGSGPWRHRLAEITAPTLVIHGTEDPFFQLPHGEALAAEIPDARLLSLPQTGHEIPPRTWDLLVPAILAHTEPRWQLQADRLAAEALAADDPTGWFDRLYGAAAHGSVSMPWDRDTPNLLLGQWARASDLTGGGRSAVVVGCGLGADAEFLAQLGFRTIAFDISQTAVRLARNRHPDSVVDYRTADLFDLPPDWIGAFDLVVEIYTVQALPNSLRPAATSRVGSLVAPGGTLLAIYSAREVGEPLPAGPPWPLDRNDIRAFATGGVQEVSVELVALAEGSRQWLAEFVRVVA